MKTPVKVWFGSHDIKDLELELPTLPRKGDVLVLPPGFVKYYNGDEVEGTGFKVRSVEFRVLNLQETRVEINVQPPRK